MISVLQLGQSEGGKMVSQPFDDTATETIFGITSPARFMKTLSQIFTQSFSTSS